MSHFKTHQRLRRPVLARARNYRSVKYILDWTDDAGSWLARRLLGRYDRTPVLEDLATVPCIAMAI